jgi:uncharacterized damage-inducible protein DinB
VTTKRPDIELTHYCRGVITLESVTRVAGPIAGDEASISYAMLDFYRSTLLTKCAGLTEEQMRLRPIAPSSLSLLGLLRHLADVERYWFGWFDGHEPAAWYSSDEHPDDDFDALDSATFDDVVASFYVACRESREICSRWSLDDRRTNEKRSREYSLRFVVIHMIEEYARHCGHADLLREVIDGATGS